MLILKSGADRMSQTSNKNKLFGKQELERCPRCNKPVYLLERISIAGDFFHRVPFSFNRIHYSFRIDSHVLMIVFFSFSGASLVKNVKEL